MTRTASTAWLALVSTLLPAVPLLYLYNRNFEDLDGLIVLAALGALCAISATVFGLSWALTRSAAAAFWVSLAWWAGMLVSKPVDNAAAWHPGHSSAPLFLLLLLLLALILVGFAARRHARPSSGLVKVSAGIVSVMILMNLMPVLWKVGRANGWLGWRAEASSGVVDRSLPSPNVYWFHCDAMMGLRSFGSCFGYDTTGFEGRLGARGFQVNPDAMLETSRTTRVALPALMCPDFYDSYLSSRLSTHERAKAYDCSVDQARLERQLATRNELVQAFEAKGYATSSVISDSAWDAILQPATQKVYHCDTNQSQLRAQQAGASKPTTSGYWKNSRLLLDAVARPIQAALTPLLDRYGRMLSVPRKTVASDPVEPNTVSRKELEALLPEPYWIIVHGSMVNGCVYSIKKSASPSLSIFYVLVAHQPFTLDFEGDLLESIDGDLENPANYAGQYLVAQELLLFLVDKILQKDPNAVIVLQADHGLHVATAEEFEAVMGRPIREVDLWNNVLCALRVPAKLRTGEESKALDNPLNMTRYLVNSFVGRRYKYLDP